MRTITINAVLNGFIVNVGCQTLAYTSREKLVLDLGDYLKDPEGTEKRILEQEGMNREFTMGRAPVPMDPQAQNGCDTARNRDECGTQETRPMGIGAVLGRGR